MEDTTTSPSQFAHDMQLRTRKQNNFDDVEASLPDPKAASYMQLSLSELGVSAAASSILHTIGGLNPFGRAVAEGDVVWLLDNTAYKHPHLGSWHAEFVVAVFEAEANCKVADIVAGIARQVGLADDAAEKKTIEQRIMPFLWDIRVAKAIDAVEQDNELKLGPTNVDGIVSQVIKISGSEGGSFVKAAASVPSGVKGILEMQTCYAGAEGWGVISDIDDTIKVTGTSDPIGILRKTFVDPPEAVPGMPELYANWKSWMPEDTPFFYLSASPYNLYPFLKEFRDQFYPPGTMILRDSSWKTISGLLSALTLGTEEYKVDRMKKINSWLPYRKMMAIGDSTQSDPEAYGEIYRTIPGWIKLVLIRKATNIAEIGLKEKNEPARFEKAFKGVPKDAWHVFEDPTELPAIIKRVLGQG